MRSLHDVNNGLSAATGILLLNELREDALKVGQAHETGKIAGGCVGEKFALGDDDDTAANLFHHFEDVRDVKDGFALGGEHFEKIFEEAGGDDIETGERLIENEELGVVNERSGDEDALAHSLGVGRDGRVLPRLKVEQTEEAFGFPLNDRFLETAEAAHELEVFEAREVSVKVGFFRDVAEDAAKGDHIVVNILTVEKNATVVGTQQAGDDFDGSGFAGAIGSEKADDFAGSDLEADVLDGGDAAVASE
jgi:hypothetical protein